MATRGTYEVLAGRLRQLEALIRHAQMACVHAKLILSRTTRNQVLTGMILRIRPRTMPTKQGRMALRRLCKGHRPSLQLLTQCKHPGAWDAIHQTCASNFVQSQRPAAAALSFAD